jgi:type IV fimbrial biogenesis protein FimT
MNAHRRRQSRRPQGRRGFTLIELMVVVAVAVLIISLAAPSFSEYIVTQRVRSIHAQLVTDIQYARSEAASRGQVVAIQFEHMPGAGGHSCYTIYARDSGANPRHCSCLETDGSVKPEGTRCTFTDTEEIRSVVIENSLKVSVLADAALVGGITAPHKPVVNFDPRTGSSIQGASPPYPATMAADGVRVFTQADASRALGVVVNGVGRALVCTPTGSNLGGLPCP